MAEDKPVKIRKTKAGFEPYQVKKFHSVAWSKDENTVPVQQEIQEKKTRKNKTNSRQSYSNSKVNKYSQKSKHINSQVEQTINKVVEKEDWDIEIANQESKKDTNENETSMIKEDTEQEIKLPRKDSLNKNDKVPINLSNAEEIRRKTQGISILECPCSNSTSESSVDGCLETYDLNKCLTNNNKNMNKDVYNNDDVYKNGFNTDKVNYLPENSSLNVNSLTKQCTKDSLLSVADKETQINHVLDMTIENKQSNSSLIKNTLTKQSMDTTHNLDEVLSTTEINSLFKNIKIDTSAINILKNEKSSVQNETHHVLQDIKGQENILFHENIQKVNVKSLVINGEMQKNVFKNRRKQKTQYSTQSSPQSSQEKNLSTRDEKTPIQSTNPEDLVLSAFQKVSADEQGTQSKRHVHFSNSDNAHIDDKMFLEKKIISEDKSTEKKETEKKFVKKNRQLNLHIKEIKEKQFQLSKLLEKGFQSMESVKLMISTAEAIQQNYVDLIILHQEFAFKFDYESVLWKSAFHNIITQFRNFLESENIPKKVLQDIGKLYWQFLQSGIQFLDMIIVNLEEHHGFSLQDYLKDPVLMLTCKKQVKLALRSCHLLLIFIGDLERYIAQLQQESSYEQAILRYKDAQILVPKNGKSYNQLAVVAVVAKRKLDAVYYYARSLQASNPILSAKERLTAIFQEIKKKARLFDQHHYQTPVIGSNLGVFNGSNAAPETHSKYNHHNIQAKKNSDHLSHEVWTFIKNGHMFKVMLTEDNNVVDLTLNSSLAKVTNANFNNIEHDKLTLRKVNKGFMIHFLLLHSMLYTNIGLENFTLVHQETLSDLTTLLQHPKASSIKQESLLKYMAINLFAIHNILDKQDTLNVVHGTSLDLAILFGMDMFSILAKHSAQLIKEKGPCDQFMPALRTWMKWLANHCELVMKSSVSSMFDVWTRCCELFNCLANIKNGLTDKNQNENGTNAYLIEDLFLAGFKPLEPTLLFCKVSTGHEEPALSNLRLKSLIEILSLMDEQDNWCYVFDEKDNEYKPIQTSEKITLSPEKKFIELSETSQEEVEDFEDDIIYEDDDNEDFHETAQISDLKAQKVALQKIIQAQEEQRNAAMAVIENQRRLGRNIFENCPSTIVADTNCYIDHLALMQALLQSKMFCIVVPLIVINELDGLKKGSSNTNHRLQQSAGLAVDMLEDWFSRKDSCLRAITSNGTEMTTIAFRAEEFSNDRGNNDDVILSCCVRYCKENITRSEGDSRIVLRSVVLLTDDRNLRVKAHTRSVPTTDIVTFIKMAKLI
ncbi:telomerase-binding protein EST1A isoform X2 [Hydra vulgaris]|uniref:telomerase-binding protein EST1A isoform X2 n=1 Tax=Hydra vulgaris TaxID=6087 RepID=UPI001F5E75DA|nr:telomerase-binding protein EST1A [Hydra vulgaris]